MGETPTELKADIDNTLEHMDAIVEALSGRLRGTWISTRARLKPGAIAKRHPLAMFGSAMAVTFGLAVLVRVNRWLSKHAQQKIPVQIYLRRPK